MKGLKTYIVTWEEQPHYDWANIMKNGMEAMYPDMIIEILKDSWQPKSAIVPTNDSLEKVKCSFYETFHLHNYGFRNLKVIRARRKK